MVSIQARSLLPYQVFMKARMIFGGQSAQKVQMWLGMALALTYLPTWYGGCRREQGGGGMEGQRHEGGCASCAERDGWRTVGQSSAYLALPNTCIRMQIRPPHTLTHSPTLLPRSPHYSPPDTRGLCLLLGYFFVPELCSVLKNPTPRTSPHLRSVLLARLLFGPGAAQRPDAHDECHGQHTQSGRHQAHLSGV